MLVFMRARARTDEQTNRSYKHFSSMLESTQNQVKQSKIVKRKTSTQININLVFKEENSAFSFFNF